MTKKKIAIIGGGVGAITTAFAITQVPNWEGKYEITVYQLGWRLGGKGASGRNARFGQRIEEHGLHVWAGFYDNAFRNMRACYEQLVTLGLRSRDAPLGTIDAAFKPLSHLFLAEQIPPAVAAADCWRPWAITLPTNDKIQGTETKVPGPFEMMRTVLSIVVSFLERGEGAELGDDTLGIRLPLSLLASHHAIRDHVNGLPVDPRHHAMSDTNRLADLIRDAQTLVRSLETPAALQDDALRRGLLLVDVMLAYMHGVVTSDSFVAGYDRLDQWEFTDWLRLNGASDAALSSVLVRGCYDFVFGFSQGNVARQGDVGAGTAVRAMSRLIFTYSGAVFYKMQAGMGDTIFGPYYQVLRALGVRFEFFCAARNLHVDPTGTFIESLSMVRQARVAQGDYQPLVNVRNLPSWPSEPLWDQLVDGERLREANMSFESEQAPPAGEPFDLHRGRDFDLVVLGASLGSLPYMASELIEASERWRLMIDRVRTVGTHAAQLWLTKDATALGWAAQVAACNGSAAVPEGPMQTIIDGFAEPLDTWADMSHLLPREDWGHTGPAMLAYFCAPAPDGEMLDVFAADFQKWRSSALTSLWPGARLDGGFDEKLIFGGDAGLYQRVNMHGSERYVLSVANSVYHRLAPDESGFSNLFLAGDWTRCGLNAGCVEAATISGIAAASAITGQALLNVGADDVAGDDTVGGEALYLTNSISGTGWPFTPFFACGEMTGWFCFYELPRAQVAAMLPPGVALGYSPMTRPGYHPVGISLCRYHDVRSSFLPGLLAMSPYGEATFAIPFTATAEGERAPFLYPRRLYVNSDPAILAGKFLYAMDKVSATIEVDDRRFHASDDRGLSIDGSFEQRSDPVALSGHPAHGAISDLLDMSFVTQRSYGRLLYNAFDLQLDRAYVAPVIGQVTVTDPSGGGFPPTSREVPPLEWGRPRGLPGAFKVWCSWSMTNPLDSRRVLKATKARHWVRKNR